MQVFTCEIIKIMSNTNRGKHPKDLEDIRIRATKLVIKGKMKVGDVCRILGV
jgi:hypothetical protein